MNPLPDLKNLLKYKLLFVTGKGGVGKTTVSLLLATLARQEGKKAIIAEVNSSDQTSLLLSDKTHSSSPQNRDTYQEEEIAPNLWHINIKPQKAFQEYVLMRIRFEALYKAVFQNKFVKNFIDAVPGLQELMCIGKIYSLVDRYDIVIVDAPATGHSIALLEISDIVTKAVPLGPLGSESKKISDLLHDQKKTGIMIVTLPEEMPVNEAIELKQYLKDRIHLETSAAILNQCEGNSLSKSEWSELLAAPYKSSVLKELIRLDQAKVKRTREYTQELMESFDNLFCIPQHPYTDFNLKHIEALAKETQSVALRGRE